MKKLVILITLGLLIASPAYGLTLGEYLGSGKGITGSLYHFDGGSSADSSGNGLNGSDTAITYSLANGKYGKGAGFDGSTSIIQTAATTTVNYTGDFTIGCWVNTNTLGVPASGARYMVGNWSGGSNGYAIRMNASAAGSLDFFTASGGSFSEMVSGAALTTNKWYSVIGVRTGSNGIIYFNGNNIKSQAMAASGSVTDPIFMGGRTGGDLWSGALDDCFTENVAWSASKVAKYYSNAIGRYMPIEQ